MNRPALTVLTLVLGGLVSGCMDGTAGAIGPGGRANALFVEGADFEAVEAEASWTSTSAPSALQLSIVGDDDESGPRCRLRERGIVVVLDPSGLLGPRLGSDLRVSHRTRLDAEGELVDLADFVQAAPIRGLRWLDRCREPAEGLGSRAARFDGTLRVFAFEPTRIEAFLETEVEAEGAGGPGEVEAFFDLALPAGRP